MPRMCVRQNAPLPDSVSARICGVQRATLDSSVQVQHPHTPVRRAPRKRAVPVVLDRHRNRHATPHRRTTRALGKLHSTARLGRHVLQIGLPCKGRRFNLSPIGGVVGERGDVGVALAHDGDGDVAFRSLAFRQQDFGEIALLVRFDLKDDHAVLAVVLRVFRELRRGHLAHDVHAGDLVTDARNPALKRSCSHARRQPGHWHQSVWRVTLGG
mmetsp:Transcript_16830/g.42512  ORF Transcript_16830/g.42512 Transcript_16830/m.42512 type:complete len:213 (-) Transcript_16830:74-712(-)